MNWKAALLKLAAELWHDGFVLKRNPFCARYNPAHRWHFLRANWAAEMNKQ
jgi:hypothetical protein